MDDEPLLLTGNLIPLDFNCHFEHDRMNGSTRNRHFRESGVSIRIDLVNLDAFDVIEEQAEISSSWSMNSLNSSETT